MLEKSKSKDKLKGRSSPLVDKRKRGRE